MKSALAFLAGLILGGILVTIALLVEEERER
jgi:hypothetical protein